MKKVFSLIITVILCISLMGCSFPKQSTTVDSGSSIDVTSIIIERVSDWDAGLDTSVSVYDYIKNISITYDSKSVDGIEQKVVSSEDYAEFEESAKSALAKYVIAIAEEALASEGYDEKEKGSVSDFFEEVLEMSAEDYALNYMGECIPTLEELCHIYSLTQATASSRASVVPSNNCVVGVENETTKNMTLSVDDGAPLNVRGFDYLYENQTCISLRDLAYALNGTSKQFNISIDSESVSITTNAAYSPIGNECTGFYDESGNSAAGDMYSTSIKLNGIKVNENEVKYYNLLVALDGNYDCYMRLIDAAMMLNLYVSQSGDDAWTINTSDGYEVAADELEESGYFDTINAALIGDAKTGEIYFGSAVDEAFPIASITKLMNYIVVMDAVTAGTITINDYVPISAEASRLSVSDDGTIQMYSGAYIPMEELLYAMLLPSSNESALALAEYVAGSQEEFVDLMNSKAEELGLTTAEFHTCNGLPSYTDTVVPRKLQNYMSAEDLFTMIGYILETYPQITTYTSTKSITLPNLGVEVKNTNPLLYNMDNILGMKSGTTNAAGCCQTIFDDYTDNNGIEHWLVAIELGAETPLERNTYIETLTRLGEQIIEEDTGLAIAKDRQIPENAEQLILLLKEKTQSFNS